MATTANQGSAEPSETMASQWTDTTIRNLALPEQGSRKLFDPALPGFGLRLTARSRTFIVQHGQARTVTTLGTYPQISLKEARKLAIPILGRPSNKKRAMGKNELVVAFLEHCQTTLRPSTVRRYALSLKNRAPVTSHDVAAFKAMYNWGLRMEYVDRNPYHLRHATYQQRDRVLTDDEVSMLWRYEDRPFTDIVRLLILTGQRRAQFGNFQSAWVHDDCIHFPSSIMKSKRPHIIPLTPWARSHIDQLAPFNGWGKSKARLDQATGVYDWRLHDARRYVATTMAKLGVPLHVTEQLLDHRSTVKGVAAIYNRHTFLPEMKDALLKYETHLATILAPGQ